ncbi:alpha/beta fold hydrolase [Corallococcus sp. bb12-1]|uniref:alpha/beta hydrolase family protein n=1 Tax=Corallococcus sp. bb12-1 TaxID=2996784 RepID=UPI00226E66FC|nr:prolyl oligopeptidase family serine peptidase [Corallococcus sp. bb12-1]MCY1047135.1 alpha/beta fold hydrolase [Corallococcus sp. bb12-1]
MMTSFRAPALPLLLIACLFTTACSRPAPPTPMTLRKTFRTQLKDPRGMPMRAHIPPSGILEWVRYPAPLGSNEAYVTPVREGARRPAMVWIHGGFSWDIGPLAWVPAARDNDQSARAFREAGMVLMLPSLRGANDNPGAREYFLGEADDVVAAIDFLAQRPDVDPARIYLGGHSTGGTLALIAAAHAPRLKGAYVFGPTHDVSGYGKTGTALDRATGPELWMRNPVSFVDALRVPTQVIEGADHGNAEAFEPLRKAAKGAPLSFLLVPGTTHFSVLAPVTELLARRLAAASAEEPTVILTEAETREALRAERDR